MDEWQEYKETERGSLPPPARLFVVRRANKYVSPKLFACDVGPRMVAADSKGALQSMDLPKSALQRMALNGHAFNKVQIDELLKKELQEIVLKSFEKEEGYFVTIEVNSVLAAMHGTLGSQKFPPSSGVL